jgi:DNA-directed RNA polymerase delta subunit
MREDKILREISKILSVSKEDIPRTIKRFKEDLGED